MRLVRRASAGDMEAILAIEQGCAELAHWSEAVWRRALEGEGDRAVFVAESRDVVAGFAVVSEVAGVAEMEAVGVVAEARRQGIARGLCERMMEWARERGAETMQLEVRAANAAALAMYGALGFVEQGRRRGYYRDPVDDAVLMERRLRKV